MFWIIIFFICMFLITGFLINYYKLLKLRELEIQFIVTSIYYEQFRYQMHQVLELIYEKAGETDPQFIKDYESIKIKLDEKFYKIGDKWIQDLQKTLGYKLNYSSWKQLITKVDPLIKDIKRNESRKRD